MRVLALISILATLAVAADESPRSRSRSRRHEVRGNDNDQGNNNNNQGNNNNNNQGNNNNNQGGHAPSTTAKVSSTSAAHVSSTSVPVSVSETSAVSVPTSEAASTTEEPTSTSSVPATTTSAAGAATTTCVVASSGFVDDVANAQAAAAACASNAVIEFSTGVDYVFQTPVTMSGLTNVEIRMNGNLHLPSNMTHVLEVIATNTNLRWFNFKGTNVQYIGSKDLDNGWIYGYGQQYWDANPANGTGIANRPHLATWELYDSSITTLKIRKPPAWCNSIKGKGITISDVFLDATTHDLGGFPFNTDGFDVAATDVVIQDIVVLNGDDAVAINNDAHNVLVQRALMGGPGSHGMSIGSLGKDATVYQNVSNIHFKDITAVNSLYAARFKSYDGGWGDVKNVTWENFHLVNVSFPIYITQKYYNQALTTNSTTSSNSTSAVNMDSFTWKNWRGTINSYQPGDATCVSDPCWYDVDGADRTQAAIISCATDSSCTNYVMDDVQLIPQAMDATTSVICENVPAANNPNFGIVCENGAFTYA